MKKFLLFTLLALLAVPTALANEVYFYFQDGEEDDFELTAPQSFVSIWNETDEEMVAVPADMAFMSYQFDSAQQLRIAPNDFDFELVVTVDGDDETYILEKEDTEWYLNLLPDADGLEIFVKVYLAGQAPGGDETSSVTMNFNIQAADESGIVNPGEFVSISYFDLNLFQTVELPIEDNFAGVGVAPGTNFEISPAEGYAVTSVMTYLPGVATVSEPGEDENVWRLAVSYEPEGDFASFFITVDREEEEPVEKPSALITQIESLQWKVEWPEYSFVSQTDSDYNDNNAFLTDSEGKTTVLYANLHGDHENPAIVFPEWGNYFTLNLANQNLSNGIYTLTIPNGYVELGTDRKPSELVTFDIEVGKEVESNYTVQFSDVEGNYFDVSWENATLLTPGITEGAYMRNVMTNEEYPLVFLHDDLFSQCQIRIYNNSKLRIGFTNNYPDLPSGMYELYIPAGYVKFNDTDNSNEAIEGHLFTYSKPWSEGTIVFNALLEEKKLTLEWTDASAISYNSEYEGDGRNIYGLTIFNNDSQFNLTYQTDFTISGNTLTVDMTDIIPSLENGECRLLVPEDCIFVTVDGITDYTAGDSFRFNYGAKEPDTPKFYEGEASWTTVSGTLVEVSWNNYELSFVEMPEMCSVYNPETGLIELAYGKEVWLSEDKTKLVISLQKVPELTYRINVPEGCLNINVDGKLLLNQGTSLDNFTSAVSAIESEGRYKVITLQGVTVLDTDNAATLDTLPRGIYIINGKKVAK